MVGDAGEEFDLDLRHRPELPGVSLERTEAGRQWFAGGGRLGDVDESHLVGTNGDDFVRLQPTPGHWRIGGWRFPGAQIEAVNPPEEHLKIKMTATDLGMIETQTSGPCPADQHERQVDDVDGGIALRRPGHRQSKTARQRGALFVF